MSRTDAEFEADLNRIDELDVDGLRLSWRQRIGGEPPPMRARDLLRRELTWALQAARFGGLDPDLRARLKVLRSNRSRGRRAKESAFGLPVGSTIQRIWKGRRINVKVLDDGCFEYAGATYRSLSVIARAITGTAWSGPRFFGLQDQGGRAEKG